MPRERKMKLEVGNTTIWSATPTPFLANGSLDTASVERLVEHHVLMGVNGLFLAGTCGEGLLMPNPQKTELIRLVKQLSGSRLQIGAQVTDTSAARVCENILAAQDAGANFVIVAAPLLPQFCNRDYVRRYFLEAIETATVPVGLYILAQPSETSLNDAVWSEFVSHPKVRLVKDSSGSATCRENLIRIRKKREDLILLMGGEFRVVEAVAAGYDGGLLGTGILIAGLIRRALKALDDGDRKKADAWQKRANDFMYDLYGRDLSLWLGGLKYALKRQGLFSTEQMHVCYPLSPSDHARIDDALTREGRFLSAADA